jgi:hypothetical protein
MRKILRQLTDAGSDRALGDAELDQVTGGGASIKYGWNDGGGIAGWQPPPGIASSSGAWPPDPRRLT